MICVYGVIDLLPDAFVQLLPRSVRVTYEASLPADVVLIATTDQFKAQYAALAKLQSAVIVFDTEEHLKNWKIPVVRCDRVSIRRALKTPNTVKYKPRDPIKKMLESSTGSFISDLQTMVYKVRDPQRQQQIRTEVFQALHQNRLTKLAAKIKNAPELQKLLLSDDANRLATAIQETEQNVSVKQAAKRNNVAVFDIQYILKFIERERNESE